MTLSEYEFFGCSAMANQIETDPAKLTVEQMCRNLLEVAWKSPAVMGIGIYGIDPQGIPAGDLCSMANLLAEYLHANSWISVHAEVKPREGERLALVLTAPRSNKPAFWEQGRYYDGKFQTNTYSEAGDGWKITHWRTLELPTSPADTPPSPT